ncbi:post-transcriptional regulator [Scopulibacillus cellulosilyticus]|uniref:Post-transcriptional regulator n=1 Tax=Scopulibacillus cellulosilyticus TaxID=2665665 RepID=A0ABW2Q0R0_9BACL
MSHTQNYQEWRHHIQPFLNSKLEEFHSLGLKRLTMNELWTFIEETMEKKDKSLKLHEFVNHVMGLSVNDYMNKLRKDMFKGSASFLEENLPGLNNPAE